MGGLLGTCFGHHKIAWAQQAKASSVSSAKTEESPGFPPRPHVAGAVAIDVVPANHPGRILAADQVGENVVGHVDDGVVGGLHSKRPFLRVVGIAGNEVDESVFHTIFGDPLGGGPEATGEAPGGDLKQAAGGDHVFHHFGMSDDAAVAFGMGKDPHEALPVEGGENRLERDVGVVRQFEKDVFAPVRQSHNLALFEQFRQFGLDPDIGPGNQRHLDSLVIESGLEGGHALPDGDRRHVAVDAQLVWRGDERSRTVCLRHPGHGDRCGEVGRAVIDPGHDVAVDVNKRRHGQVTPRNQDCTQSRRIVGIPNCVRKPK